MAAAIVKEVVRRKMRSFIAAGAGLGFEEHWDYHR